MSRTFTLRTVSPVHIGSGRSIDPIDIAVENNMVYHLNRERFLDSLNSSELDCYTNWLEEYFENVNDLTQDTQDDNKYEQNNNENDQKMKELRQQFNLPSFIKDKLEEKKQLADELFKDDNYKYASQLVTKIEDHKEIREQLKNPEHIAYIPGSSIKGFIRTAMANRVLSHFPYIDRQKLLDKLSRILKYRESYSEKAEKLAQALEQDCFYCGMIKKNSNFENYNLAQYDLFKFVKISDTFNEKPVPLNSLITDRFKISRDNGLCNLKPQGSRVNMEAIQDAVEMNFEINVDILGLKNIIRTRKPPYNTWLSFGEKFYQLFKLSIDQLKKKGEDELKQKIIDSILSAVNDFSRKLIQSEQDWLHRFSQKEANNILDFYSKKIDRNKHYLRIGQGTGFHSKTVLLTMLNNRNFADFGKILFDTFITRNNKDSDANKPKAIDGFPVSRSYILADNGLPLLPLGWVQITENKL